MSRLAPNNDELPTVNYPAFPLPGHIARSLTVLFPLILAGCAGQIAPGGGPVDTTPPAIIRTTPDSAATHITDASVEFEFSEYVDRLSVQQSIFVSPFVGTLSYDWSGRTVHITFGDSLKKNTTYVVNVGTDVKDLNAGNKMAQGFSLAFTTGDSIDQGAIEGRVFDDRPDGVMLFAYKLDNIKRDTLDPTHTKPDYIQQSGKDGSFQLSHLAWGSYRVFAIRDEYRNLVYDRQVDDFGVWRSDVVLSREHPTVGDVIFRLTKEDTTRPFLTSATLVGRKTLLLHFSEAIDTTGFENARFSVVDTLSQSRVPLRSWYIDTDHPMDAGILLAESPDSGRGFRVSGVNVRDLAGNVMDSVHGSVEFVSTSEPDTARPIMKSQFADSARNVRGDQPLVLDFSKRTMPVPLNRAIRLLDSTNAPVPFGLSWRGGLSLALQPRHELLQAAWYRLEMTMDSVRDYSGNGYSDSTLVLHFRTFDYRSTGTLEGTVRTDTTVKSPLLLTAHSVDLAPVEKKSIRVGKDGPFVVDRLVEGKWTVTGFVDVDGTGSYHFGLPFPFNPSAPFGVSADTVKVRARWGVKGVRLELH